MKERFRGSPAPVRLVSKEAERYQTVLKRGAKKGPNFAGHYTIVGWRNGTYYDMFAVIDAKTGDVFFPDFPFYYVPYDPSEEEEAIMNKYSVGYRLGSRLLVTQGSIKSGGVFFYKWERDRFLLIHSVAEAGKQGRQ